MILRLIFDRTLQIQSKLHLYTLISNMHIHFYKTLTDLIKSSKLNYVT